MPAPMEKTRHPGIYKRGSKYVVVYRVGGRQRKESARTLEEARQLKRAREADRDRGEFQADSRLPFSAYALEWVERYQGHGRRGFREDTRDDYRRDLKRYAIPYFGDKLGRTVSAITPRDVANWIAWLCEQPNGRGGQPLSDQTVRRILAPVRSSLATAVHEGIVRHNPCVGAALPHRPKVDEDDEEVRALTREQLAGFLTVVHPRHRLLFQLLAATGLRWSEVTALQWRHVVLDGDRPRVKVRRRLRRGSYGPPKSRHGRRDVPLPFELVRDLRVQRATTEQSGDDALVFSSLTGTPLDHADLLRRVLRPAAEEADAPWAGFHTFRHTCASLLFARGANAKQVQKWLGHHSPAFTLETYVHLLSDDLGEPLELAAELQSGNGMATHGRGLSGTQPETAAVNLAA